MTPRFFAVLFSFSASFAATRICTVSAPVGEKRPRRLIFFGSKVGIVGRTVCLVTFIVNRVVYQFEFSSIKPTTSSKLQTWSLCPSVVSYTRVDKRFFRS